MIIVLFWQFSVLLHYAVLDDNKKNLYMRWQFSVLLYYAVLDDNK